MIVRLIPLWFFFGIKVLFSGGPHGYQEGKTFSQDLSSPSIDQISSHDIPNYPRDTVPESNYFQNSGQINSAATSMTHDVGDEVGAVVREGLKTRKAFPETFDKNNLIIQAGNGVVDKPLEYIGGSLEGKVDTVVEVLETTHTCDEAGDLEKHTCDKIPTFTQRFFEAKRYLNTTISGTMFKRYHVGGSPQYANIYTRGYGHDQAYNLTVVDEKLGPMNWHYHDGCNNYPHTVRHNYETYTDFEIVESEQDSCSTLETHVDNQTCTYRDQRCVEGPETRVIFGRPVFKECWCLRRAYLCGFVVPSACAVFRSEGCDQTGVKCKKRVGDQCTLYTKTFICRSNRYQNGQIRITGEVPFCLDGNCHTYGFDENRDFADVVSKLSIFREIGKDFESGITPSAFKGTPRRCSRSILNFQDCCGSGGGWGANLKIAANCSGEEHLLQIDRKNNTCVYVGNHCVEKDPVTKRCLKKKSTYCCFGSKIAKLVQEQGRAQLSLGWGDSKTPSCRALSVDELQRLDFDRLDLSELFDDVRKKTNISSVKGAAQDLTKEWSIKAKSIKKSTSKKGEGPRVF